MKVMLLLVGFFVFFALCTAGSVRVVSIRYAGYALSNREIFVLELPNMVKGLIVSIASVYFWEAVFKARERKRNRMKQGDEAAREAS